MSTTRRGFIKTLAFGILGKIIISSTLLKKVFAKPADFENGIEIEKGYIVFNSETQKTMESLADTLIPGARKIGIKTKFMEHISKDYGLAGFLDAGFWNLDTISKQRFKKPYYKLHSKEEKEAIIKHVYSRNINFINLFKSMVIDLYYSNPSVWKKLSYNGPPQPKGFMNYSLPPNQSME